MVRVVDGEHVDGHELQQTEVTHRCRHVAQECREHVQHLARDLRETLHTESEAYKGKGVRFIVCI